MLSGSLLRQLEMVSTGQTDFETSLLLMLFYSKLPKLQNDGLGAYLKTCTRCAWQIIHLLIATCSSNHCSFVALLLLFTCVLLQSCWWQNNKIACHMRD